MGVFCDRLKLCYIAAPDCQIAQCSGALCQFSFLWSYYYGSNKSTTKETGKHTSVDWPKHRQISETRTLIPARLNGM